jgi:hypothetical protein
MITHTMLMWTSVLLIIVSNFANANSSARFEYPQRRLLGYDAWATAPMCQQLPTAASTTDSLGRRWGWEQQASCAFKDEQQQPVYPQSSPALQQWSAAVACPEAPTPQNSAADRAARLWGVWYGKYVWYIQHHQHIKRPCRHTSAVNCMHAHVDISGIVCSVYLPPGKRLQLDQPLCSACARMQMSLADRLHSGMHVSQDVVTAGPVRSRPHQANQPTMMAIRVPSTAALSPLQHLYRLALQ